jgi:lysophospholipase L1-like esterase
MKSIMIAVALALSAHVALAQTPTVTAFGDSITNGFGVSSADAYPALIAADKSWTLNNLAASSTQAEDVGQADRVFQQSITASSKSIILSGYNDMRAWGTIQNGLDTYEGTLRALLVWLATPATKKVNGQSTAVSKTGPWTSLTTSAYPTTIGIYSSQLNATATMSVYGTVVYVTSIRLSTGGGAFSITIDGVNHGTYSCSGAQITTAGMAYAPFAVRVGGLEEGLHTVVITVTTAANTYLMSVSGNLGVTTLNGPSVWVGNCLRMTASGYPLGGSSHGNGSDAAAAKYNTVIRRVVRELASDGLNIGLADAAAVYDLSTEVQSDQIHPNTAGHRTIADAFLFAMEPTVRAGDRTKP